MEDTDRVFVEDKLQKGRAGHFAEKNLRNLPKAQERQTETRAY